MSAPLKTVAGVPDLRTKREADIFLAGLKLGRQVEASYAAQPATSESEKAPVRHLSVVHD